MYKEAADLQAWKEKYASYLHKQQQSTSRQAPATGGLTLSLTDNLAQLQAILGQSGNLVVRDFLLFGRH